MTSLNHLRDYHLPNKKDELIIKLIKIFKNPFISEKLAHPHGDFFVLRKLFHYVKN